METVPISRARTPIVRCTLRHGDAHGKVEITFNNPLGIHNSHLLRAYFHSSRAVHMLGWLIKMWVKVRALAETGSGCLSKYVWMLLLVFWAQTRSPPLLPNL
ncbi:unnamed protein product [Vitrella brassicaformis CCMP3155]|uniref:Poly(A) RNA polymerase mitochondrial-like central palm domain-containing protein n=1 Tax=Vitrella brassicaformis (strain CCMP3155) TaxID=1169540 RepID=A0A0G4FTK8_VITBC|nr:unnamed protein product [Vitrella brassicaformis CCMP3155]|eukprot:CEM17694.1 unnamed protein product [Vitrella brassicaformis CCMP3155]